jgi:hypothetical protein
MELLFRKGLDPRRGVPIRLRIGGLDLLGSTDDTSENTAPPAWLPLPLMAVALLGLQAVRQTRAIGRSGIEINESGEALLFLAEADAVLVHSTLMERTARVPYVTLHDTWQRFATEAVAEYTTWYPEEGPRYKAGLTKALRDDPTTFGASAWHFWGEEHRACFDRIGAAEP